MTDHALRTHLRRFSLSAALLLTVFGKCFCQPSVSVDAFVPSEHEVIGEDQYVCFRVDLPKESLKIVGVDPLSTQDVVHHMLLFGTKSYACTLSVYVELQTCQSCCMQTYFVFLPARLSAAPCHAAATCMSIPICMCLPHTNLCANPSVFVRVGAAVVMQQPPLLPGCESKSARNAGCASEGPPNEAWPCHMTSPCRGGFERVLYGWGKNAPAMSLPSGVGYSVGPGSAIQSLVLQVSSLPAELHTGTI